MQDSVSLYSGTILSSSKMIARSNDGETVINQYVAFLLFSIYKYNPHLNNTTVFAVQSDENRTN